MSKVEGKYQVKISDFGLSRILVNPNQNYNREENENNNNSNGSNNEYVYTQYSPKTKLDLEW